MIVNDAPVSSSSSSSTGKRTGENGSFGEAGNGVSNVARTCELVVRTHSLWNDGGLGLFHGDVLGNGGYDVCGT